MFLKCGTLASSIFDGNVYFLVKSNINDLIILETSGYFYPPQCQIYLENFLYPFNNHVSQRNHVRLRFNHNKIERKMTIIR